MMRAGLIWWRCWAAYALYMALPWMIARHCNFMLPAVGAYAHSEDFDDFVASTSYFQPSANQGERE
jgi:hypothetical protein